jgi:hypothetical protein
VASDDCSFATSFSPATGLFGFAQSPLTLEAQKRIAERPLSKREIIRRLGTSAGQLCRLLDQTNNRNSVDQLLALLQVLNCDVDLVVGKKTA